MAESIISDSYDVTTILGSSLGLASLLPIRFDYQRDLSLDRVLNTEGYRRELTDDDLKNTRLQYFGVGIRGCYNTTDEILTTAYHPSRLNMNLYTPIPIRCVPVNEDLSETERAKYRVRVKANIGQGDDIQTYILYYLKKLEFDGTIKYKEIDPTTGDETDGVILSDAYLSPTPVKPTTDSALSAYDRNIIAYADAHLTLEADEILEYIRAVYHGDTRYARISELGFFTGVEQEISVPAGDGTTGTNITYTEAINVHLYNHSTWIGTPLTHSGMKMESTFQIMSSGAILSK